MTDAVVTGAEASIRKGSKSFAVASRLFGQEMREDAWMLYAWCRHCDDVVDGRNLDLAEIAVATFNGTNFLKRVDGGAFEATTESGQALFGKASSIVGSSLESSNTDIADEFTKLIVTQQAYSANTKVITTSTTMVQDLLNVMR